MTPLVTQIAAVESVLSDGAIHEDALNDVRATLQLFYRFEGPARAFFKALVAGELEGLRSDPAVAAVLAEFPDAEIAAVRRTA